MSGSGPLSGLGRVTFWGLSPAKDLLRLIDKVKLRSSKGGRKSVNILLAGEADSRHAFTTLAENWELLQQNDIRLNFYIVESFLEQYARQMLFWTLALQPLNILGLHEKTTQFMELFGNSYIRPQTNKSLLIIVDDLIKMATCEESKGIFDLTEMKFRERDTLVEMFRHWRTFSDFTRFCMAKQWTGRVNRHLGTRYDSRANVFDWDYNMKLVEKGAKIVSSQEYKKWRDTGIAFADFDSDYSQPNVTLAAGVSRQGGIHMSYLGEIVTGPFISYGIESLNKDLFEKANDRYKNQSYDVTYHNLSSIFKTISPLPDEQTNGDPQKSAIDLISLHFISPLTFGRAEVFSKFGNGFFDIAYFGNSMVQQILPPLATVIATDATILTENILFVLESRDEQSKLFEDKVLELGMKAGFEHIEISDTPPGENLPCFLQFVQGGGDKHLLTTPAETEENITETNPETLAECVVVEQAQELELEKNQIVKEVECSPQGDAAFTNLQ